MNYRVLGTDYAWPSLRIERETLAAVGAELLVAETGEEAELVELPRSGDAILTNSKTVPLAALDAAPRCLVVSPARGFGLRVLVYTPRLRPGRLAESVEATGDLGRLLTGADYVSVHAPSGPETRGLIGEAELCAERRLDRRRCARRPPVGAAAARPSPARARQRRRHAAGRVLLRDGDRGARAEGVPKPRGRAPGPGSRAVRQPRGDRQPELPAPAGLRSGPDMPY